MNGGVQVSAAPPRVRADARPEFALIALLDQLRDMLATLRTTEYCASPAPSVSGTVGEHVRHLLDHVAALVANTAGELSYDSRRRGTMVECDPSAAMIEIDRLVYALDALAEEPLDRTVRLVSLVDRGGLAVPAQSTLAREVAFVIHHTTHHYAIIALLLDRLGIRTPTGFGVAPSTPLPH